MDKEANLRWIQRVIEVSMGREGTNDLRLQRKQTHTQSKTVAPGTRRYSTGLAYQRRSMAEIVIYCKFSLAGN